MVASRPRQSLKTRRTLQAHREFCLTSIVYLTSIVCLTSIARRGAKSGLTVLQYGPVHCAGVAQLVERHVANVQVDGSSPFTRSNFP